MAKLFDPTKFAVATIWQEARGEPLAGKIAVGEVIRTRTRERIFSDGTIESTILWPFQFSGWNPKDPNRILSVRLDDEDPVVKDCFKAWDASATSTLTKNATHYLNLAIAHPLWYESSKVIIKIGNHTFLRL